MIRETAWHSLVDDGKVMVQSPQKPSVAKYVQLLCKAMAAEDSALQGNLKTKLHSSSKKYGQLTAYVRYKCKGVDESFTESEQSGVSKFQANAEDESLLFDDPPAKEHSKLGQTMTTTAGCNSTMVPESEQSPAKLIITPT